MLRIAIVEDDRRYSEQLEGHLKRYAAESGVEMQITYFSDGMDIAEEYKPVWDLIFLDIEMPLLDGMSAAERIRSFDTEVLMIFVTNLAKYAIRGYGVSALDYVLKPMSYESFYLKMDKAVHILRKRDEKSVILNLDGEAVKLPLADIQYVEVADHRLFYHTKNRTYHSFQSLRELEEQFGSGFARCNHCYLVNLRHVTGVKDDCVLVGEEKLKISRPKKKEFMQKLSDYYRFGV